MIFNTFGVINYISIICVPFFAPNLFPNISIYNKIETKFLKKYKKVS